jgi:hypothetical protein
MNLTWCVIALAAAGTAFQTPTKAGEPREVWPMSLREAIRIALENSASVRVTFAGDRNSGVGCRFDRCEPVEDVERRPRPLSASRTSIIVEPLDADSGIPRTKSEVMAIVRTVAGAYWHLAEAHAAHWAADRAVNRTSDLIDIEQAFGDPDCPQDLDELAATVLRLKQFEKQRVERRSDVNTAERVFRGLLGLAESDDRRIIPVSPPTKAALKFAWGTCLDDVLTKLPNLVRVNALCRRPRKNLIEAIQAFDDNSPQLNVPYENELNDRFWALSAAPIVYRVCGQVQAAPWELLQFPNPCRRAGHQLTPRFAEAVLKADSSYERYSKAEHARVDAQEQMEAQRDNWATGRVRASSYFDCIEEWAALVANEQNDLAAYNSALFAVNECRGTMLENHDIIVQKRVSVETPSSFGDNHPALTGINFMEETIR